VARLEMGLPAGGIRYPARLLFPGACRCRLDLPWRGAAWLIDTIYLT